MLQIRLLGQFDIRLDGKRVTISTRVAQSLFAYLALTAGTAHRREKLAGLFWPDASEEKARTYLRQELWRIRKAIPSQEASTQKDYLSADGLSLTFNRQADYWLDVSILERPDSDLESLTSSLSLYQGELLPGFYDDWTLLERERIRNLFESKMHQLVEKLVQSERWAAVQEQCEHWLSLGYPSEPAYRAMMIAYSVRGDLAKVSVVYHRCVNDLLDQLGVVPSAETTTLYNGLLKGAQGSHRTGIVQPSGTVTFLFTDIEESTRLLDKLGIQYATSLAEHHLILRAAIQKWNGREIDTQGDAFFVTFARALDAVQCAAEAQRNLASHSWPLGEPVRVRMGLHTGEPLITSTGYLGIDVHRAARIGDAGHGGQILLSQTTRELVIHDLPQGMKVLDLGDHRLKDMKFPTPIFQLVVEGLPVEFPPLKTKFTGMEAPTPGEPPFKGLQYFDEADCDLFFGREVPTQKLAEQLKDTQFISVIIGASGSGKSSLVRAGLIPVLRKESVSGQILIITPTAHPLEALATELIRESESVTTTATLIDDLAKDPRSLALYLARRNKNKQFLLLVDQFEELFTLCRDEFERQAFIDNLLAAISLSVAGESAFFTLILTLRADFYAHLAQYPELRDLVAKHQEYIGPMSTEELRRAIEEPAKRGHWEFEPGLVELILRDVGDEPGALPLLSHALLETWKRRAGHTLTLKGYADAGGVHGAIAHTAETVYQNFLEEEQSIAREIFLRLTELGEGTEDTRRRASFDELMSTSDKGELIRDVLNKLAEARLVTLSETTADIAHEALIREWSSLREWLNQDREGLRLHRHLTESAYDWELLGRDPGALYRGAHLIQAREWATLHSEALNATERAFLSTSIEQEQYEELEREVARQRELEAERQRVEEQMLAAKRLRKLALYLAGAFTAAFLMAFIAVFFGEQARQAANSEHSQQLIATSRELAAASVSNLEVDPERSILLALEALNSSYTGEAEDALHRAVQTSRLQRVIRVHEAGPAMMFAISPNGEQFVTAVSDGSVKTWNTTTGKNLLDLDGYYAAYSPDGKRLAILGADGVVLMVDTQAGRKIDLPTQIHVNSGIAISPDGSRLAAATAGNLAAIWDAANGQKLMEFVGHTDHVRSATFSPDGKRLLTASDDGTARVWEVNTGKQLLLLSAYLGRVWNALYSPDGNRIVTLNGNETQLWDANSGQRLFTLAGHTGDVYTAAFSADGSRIATGGADRRIIVWDTMTGKELFRLTGHAGAIDDVAFNQAGTRLFSSSDDGTVRNWDLTPSHEALTLSGRNAVGKVTFIGKGAQLAVGNVTGRISVWDMSSGKELPALAREGERISSFAFSPDETLLALADAAGTVRLLDAATGRELSSLKGHDGQINDIAFSPDGTTLATAGEDWYTYIWNAPHGVQLYTLLHYADVQSLVFSPDGSKLVTGFQDGTAKVWEVASGHEILTYEGHQNTIMDVAFSPDGTLIASANRDGSVNLWNVSTGQDLYTLRGHSDVVTALSFSPDGKRIATVSGDGMTKLWDAETGEELLTLVGSGAPLYSVAFDLPGTHLATSGEDGTRIYLLHIEDLVALARTRVTRPLTSEECQQYLHLNKSNCSKTAFIPTIAPVPSASHGRICLVADPSALGLASPINKVIQNGMQAAADQFNWEKVVQETTSEADIRNHVNRLLNSDCNLIVVAFAEAMDAVQNAALAKPDQKFLFLDNTPDLSRANVLGQLYASDQAAFLAGYAAASVSKTGKVGVFGGMDISSVTNSMEGFALGVQYYNEHNGTSVEVLGWDPTTKKGLFVGGFCCTSEGKAIANQLLDQGADIILPIAGDAGPGAAAAVKAHGHSYIIGVDTDWALSEPEYADIVLTSVMKNFNVSVVQTVKAIEENTFFGGPHIGTLETGEVGLAPFHNQDSLISPEVKANLEQMKTDIISGKIKTGQ